MYLINKIDDGHFTVPEAYSTVLPDFDKHLIQDKLIQEKTNLFHFQITDTIKG